MNIVSENLCFGGRQLVIEHHSDQCSCDMRVGVFLPPDVAEGAPALYFLSGLTCTEDNFITKAGAQRVAAELGLVIVAPDTSPRGEAVADVEDWDFGKGAGFYLSATQPPWSDHYRMDRYVVEELTALVQKEFGTDPDRQGISGHSMGGHGALTLHLKHPDQFHSVSAFAPIVAPTRVPWGQKAFKGYLGDDPAAWSQYDACKLVRVRASDAHVLIDQGSDDPFLDEQLKPELFLAAAQSAGQPLTLNLREGYDHSYYFVASFIEDHLRHHAEAL